MLSGANRTGTLAVYRIMNGQPMVTALPVALPDEQADRLSALFDAHHDRLYRLARRLAPSVDDALDLVQETFLKAARSPNAVPSGVTNEEAWLVRVLINVRRDQWRKTAVRARHDVELGRPSADEKFRSCDIQRATVAASRGTLEAWRR